MLRDLCKGETRRLMTEKQGFTTEVDGAMSNANLKSLIWFGKLWAEHSELIYEYGLIVFK